MIGPLAAGAGRKGFLLLRRGGGLWGIASSAVDSLSRRGGAYRIGVGENAILADEIIGVVDDLLVRPSAGVLGRFWCEPAAGLAIHGELPLVVLDPRHPPGVLRPADDDSNEGDRSA
ncbi:MAG TPA: hypothetical protein VHU81_08815 [Thermoanaerobaculia bacterium]|nr:hypothetical protein [Thermoanaerobaculia bacterium]